MGQSQFSYHVFISYRSAVDKESACVLFDDLSTRSHPQNDGPVNVFLDERSLTIGDNWREGFMRGLKQSKIAILLISEKGLIPIQNAHLKTDNALLEYELALSLREDDRIIVIPVFLGNGARFNSFSCESYPSDRHLNGSTTNTVRETMEKLFSIQGIFVDNVNLITSIVTSKVLDILPAEPELSRGERITGLVSFLLSAFGLATFTKIFSERFDLSNLNLRTLTSQEIKLQIKDCPDYLEICTVDDVVKVLGGDVKEHVQNEVQQVVTDFTNVEDSDFDLAKSFEKSETFRFMNYGVNSLLSTFMISANKFRLKAKVYEDVLIAFKNSVTNHNPHSGWFLYDLGEGEDSISPIIYWYDKNETNTEDYHMLPPALHAKRYSITYVSFKSKSMVEKGYIYNLSNTSVEFKMRRKEFDTYEELLAWYKNVKSRMRK
eukprot:gene5771-6208_t